MTGSKLGFIGAGQMAEAIIRGVVKAGLTSYEQIAASDIRADRLRQLTAELGIRTSTENWEVMQSADIIILSVKPQDVVTVLSASGGSLHANQLVVSIAAGVTLATIESHLAPHVPAIRVMPNTPCLVGAGMAAVARGHHATDEHVQTALSLFNAVGRAVALPEYLIDAVTGLSGSGPAFVALFIEALSDGGVRAGLPRDVATQLAVQTTLGTAQLVQQTGLHPGQVKDNVSSPGGTTIAGVHALERAGFRAALMDAVVAATQRSAELGKQA
ncbi:MAG: pyrroline-5-carboxylate reductase [Chloroflexota bacterium]